VSGAVDDEPRDGAVDPALTEELPGLRLRWTLAAGGAGRTPAGLRERLGDASTRFRGANAVQLRTRPVPRAYRVFFRHVGLDPDVDRTPVEALAVDRLIRGELVTGDLVSDALILALMETGVPVVAFADETLAGEVVLRAAGTGETLPAEAGYAHDVPSGRLVLADDDGPVAILFGRMSEEHQPAKRTTRVRLVAIAVPGVPSAHVDEALWLAATAFAE
jgi:DNA/RNA-binding domain of Phe-tRNA-synthetase-like protein